jgi:hypothetical protein
MMDKRESEGTVEEPLDLIKLSLDERMYLVIVGNSPFLFFCFLFLSSQDMLKCEENVRYGGNYMYAYNLKCH